MRVCRWEHLCVCVETVCHISLVHGDHFAKCLPRPHLLSERLLLVFAQILQTHFMKRLFRCRLLSVVRTNIFVFVTICDGAGKILCCCGWSNCKSTRSILQEALCLPRVCDRSRGDGWYNGVYLRSHSLTLPSVWHSNQGDTFLPRDVTGCGCT